MRLPIIIASFTTLIICGSFSAPTPPDDFDPLKEGYELFWADEFSEGKLDTTKWRHRYLGKRKNAYVSRDAVTVSDGMLHLTVKKQGDKIITGMIGTEETFMNTFGYYECKMQFQNEGGSSSAFWLQCPTMNNVGDSKKYGAEIDIIEYRRAKSWKAGHTVHWDGYGEEHKRSGSSIKRKKFENGWHTFGLEWNEKEYVFYIDGKETWRTSDGISHAKQYIVLSFEIHDWGGDITEADLPDSVKFDYVRVYKKK